MRLKSRSVVALALVFVLGHVNAGWSERSAPAADPATTAGMAGVPGGEVHSNAPDLIIAATYSRKCATEFGTCTIDTPLPIGSRCSCDGSEGRIVR
jgi:hypothetical protein